MPGWHIQIWASRSPFFYVYYVWTQARIHYKSTLSRYRDETYV